MGFTDMTNSSENTNQEQEKEYVSFQRLYLSLAATKGSQRQLEHQGFSQVYYYLRRSFYCLLLSVFLLSSSMSYLSSSTLQVGTPANYEVVSKK